MFKIDFEVDVITASAQVSPSAVGCAPFTVDFAYTGEDAETVVWDFGDGSGGTTQFNPTHTFENPGIYTVTQIAQNANSCNVEDVFELQIEVLPRPIGVPSEVVYCISDGGVLLEALEPNDTYRWQDGSTGNTFQAPAAGIYWVDIGSSICPRRDSFTVNYTSDVSVELGPDTFFVCDTNIFFMDAFNADAVSYRWQDGSGNPTFETSIAGTYSVQLTDASGCQVSDTISVNFGTLPVLDLGPDIFTCDPAPISFDVNGPGYTYRWQDGSTLPTFTVQNSGTYSVVVDNAGCELADSIVVA